MHCSSLETCTGRLTFGISYLGCIQTEARRVFVEEHALGGGKKGPILFVVWLYDPQVVSWMSVYLLTPKQVEALLNSLPCWIICYRTLLFSPHRSVSVRDLSLALVLTRVKFLVVDCTN